MDLAAKSHTFGAGHKGPLPFERVNMRMLRSVFATMVFCVMLPALAAAGQAMHQVGVERSRVHDLLKPAPNCRCAKRWHEAIAHSSSA